MKILIILFIVLFCGGCYEDYEPRPRSRIKTYNELFPVTEWEIERITMALEEIEREKYR